MRAFAETIVAPITGTHPAPVSIVRLSGPDAWRIAAEVFSPWPKRPEPLKAVLGSVVGCDVGLALPFGEGRSYTGEECAEISVHGSRASVEILLDACIAAGARMATPGEFTLRAFLNGRLDLTQAEGIRDTIEAQTGAQLRLAALHRGGGLREQIGAIRNGLLGDLATIEATIDFSEEIGELDRGDVFDSISKSRTQLLELLSTAPLGRMLRQGVRVALAGQPNVGKSSLLNTLIGMDRAIVTDIPGTTRDYVEEQLSRSGYLWVFVDTAGLHETSDVVERLGVERSRDQIRAADCVWYLYDARTGMDSWDRIACESIQVPKVVLANKSDLEPDVKEGIPVCAVDGAGVETAFRTTIQLLDLDRSEGGPLLDVRHASLIERALLALEGSLEALRSTAPDDLSTVGLRSALQALGELTGESAEEDMLERIFADFCVGK